MRLLWQISARDVKSARNFFEIHEQGVPVQNRHIKMEQAVKVPVAQSCFWEVMLVCLLTTQQRSGPGSYVNQFITRNPFPLSFEDCKSNKDVERHICEVLKKNAGIRYVNKIADHATLNLEGMHKGLWEDTFQNLETVRKAGEPGQERLAALFIQKNYKGFGPKQSRNLLQTLGLSRYEIPIDSRITKWLNEFGFPIRLTEKALADENYYQFVSEGFQRLCSAAGIWPCLMDAAIFSSYDRDSWTKENIYF